MDNTTTGQHVSSGTGASGIVTIEELFNKFSSLYQFEEGSPEYLIDKEDFKKALVEYTEAHLEEFSDRYAYAPDGLWQGYAHKFIK